MTQRSRAESGRVMLIITDGLGFDYKQQCRIIENVWADLTENERESLIDKARAAIANLRLTSVEAEEIALMVLCPIHAEVLPLNVSSHQAETMIQAMREIKAEIPPHTSRRIDESIRKHAHRVAYVPWSSHNPFIIRFRNAHMTAPTLAAGEWVGMEESRPPIQGNSETGHQHIGSLVMAPQTAREISTSIVNGSFFKNAALTQSVKEALKRGRNINFCFMLSGFTTNDGRVHSAWNHLEAFLRMVFVKLDANPESVRMQAILDGRDSDPYSSVQGGSKNGRYLYKLRDLLTSYGAADSLAWVIGRGCAMDRDYREQSARIDWQLLTEGAGIAVQGIDGAIDAVQKAHAQRFTDHDIPPIAVMNKEGNIRKLEHCDTFVNLNFRADRQRAKAAMLAGNIHFLLQESQARRRKWKAEWLDNRLALHYCSIAPVHPDIDSLPNVSAAFTESELPCSLLTLWGQPVGDVRYVLLAESVKASHMGYFIRGRREAPVHPRSEVRIIIPSAGLDEGVRSDSDFHLTPAMKMEEVADKAIEHLYKPENRFIACNLAAPDMLGHLLPERFGAAVAAYEATDAAVRRIIESASKAGWHVILTSDHGNIEANNPSHTANPILTTIAPPNGRYRFAKDNLFIGRLFDVAYTISLLLGNEKEARSAIEKSAYKPGSKFAGRGLVDI